MKKNKKTNVTFWMLFAIILMVLIVAIIFVVFFVGNGRTNYNTILEDSNENTINEVSENEVEIINIAENEKINNSTNQEIESGYNESFLGNYIWKDEYNKILFSLYEENDVINYSMSYYPDETSYAKEELTGIWSTAQNIVSVDNENEDSIATYSFNDITYNENGTIEINVQVKEIMNSELENYKIPNGKYIFEKNNKS